LVSPSFSSAVLEANGGQTDSADEPEGADAEMTSAFRAFARD
jgi:hypothetical protein